MNFLTFYRLNFFFIGICFVLLPSPSHSQITSDKTLGVPTTVTSNDSLNFVITNGTQVGTNLFHSFQDFSIPNNGSAVFSNPASIVNIIGRVTGNQSSFIDGLLQVTGQANLFFLNPNGIIFGKNASFDMSGSFLATTANSIRFADGQLFSATPQSTDSLLTITVPVGLQFGTRSNGIAIQQSILRLSPDNSRFFRGRLICCTGECIRVRGKS